MRIARDGTWFYMGTPIARPALVKLFATVLRKDPERYVLVTPVERVGIEVEDAPFLAVEMAVEGEGDDAPDRLPHQCGRRGAGQGPTTRCGSSMDAGGGVKPYIRVRGDLWALVTRRAGARPRRPRRGAQRRWRASITGSRSAEHSIPSSTMSEPGSRLMECHPSAEFLATRIGAASARAAGSGPIRCPIRGAIIRSTTVPLVHPLQPKSAAVLVPVVMRQEPTLLFTERSSELRQHSGQIAFPGGRVDPDRCVDRRCRLSRGRGGDRARRPAHPRSWAISIAYLSTTNYLVMPVVAEVAPDYTLTLNPHEVAHTFEVPLGFLMDPSHHELHSREWKGRLRRFYAIPYGEHYIWGVTAGIVRNLYERLYTP